MIFMTFASRCIFLAKSIRADRVAVCSLLAQASSSATCARIYAMFSPSAARTRLCGARQHSLRSVISRTSNARQKHRTDSCTDELG